MTDTAEKQTTSEQEYVLAGGKNGATDSPNDVVMATMPQTKQGHKCCGGCCDMRRATMIVNFVNMGIIFLGLWYILEFITISSSGQVQVDDDAVQDVYSEAGDFKALGIIIAIMVVRLVCNGCGAYGAYAFNYQLVAVSLAAYGLEVIFSLIAFNLAGLLMAGFFAYPHVFLINEIRAGIMTKENYPVEEQSCCCV